MWPDAPADVAFHQHHRRGFQVSDLMAGKVVVVTGGASGIGRATAVAFARRVASLMIGDIDGAEAEKAVGTIRDKGGEASCVRIDVAKPAEVQNMIASAVGRYGGLDYAFNNAGFPGPNAGILDTSEEDQRLAHAFNLLEVDAGAKVIVVAYDDVPHIERYLEALFGNDDGCPWAQGIANPKLKERIDVRTGCGRKRDVFSLATGGQTIAGQALSGHGSGPRASRRKIFRTIFVSAWQVRRQGSLPHARSTSCGGG